MCKCGGQQLTSHVAVMKEFDVSKSAVFYSVYLYIRISCLKLKQLLGRQFILRVHWSLVLSVITVRPVRNFGLKQSPSALTRKRIIIFFALLLMWFFKLILSLIKSSKDTFLCEKVWKSIYGSNLLGQNTPCEVDFECM